MRPAASLFDLDLAAIRAFLAVVEAGGISAAARRTGAAKSVISERVSGLERALGVSLFNRGARLSLTERGQALAEGMARLAESFDEMVHEVSGDGSALSGRIRVTTSAGLGVRYLGAAIAAFLAEHPNVEAEINYDDRFVDIAQENYDLALRIGRLTRGDLVGRRLCAIRCILCASPDYLVRHGVPSGIEDLKAHRGIGYSLLRSSDQWRFLLSDGRSVRAAPPRLAVLANNGEAVRDAALAGLGLSNLPSFFVAQDIAEGRLLPLALDAAVQPVELWALHPPRREPRLVAAALTAWLSARIGNPPFWEANLSPGGASQT